MKRLGRKRLESVLKQLNRTNPDTAGSRQGKRAFEMPPWQLMPAKYFGLFDDFMAVSGVTDLTQDDNFTAAGTSPAVTLDNAEVGGAVKIVAGTADDDVARLFAVNCPFELDASNARQVWMEARLKLSDVDATGFFFGLAGVGTSGDDNVETAILASTPSLADGVGFQIVDGTAAETIATITAVGDAETVTQSDVTLTDGTYVILSMYFDGSTAHFYINGELKLSTSSNLPTDGTNIAPHIEFIQQTGDSDSLHVDYVNYCMER